MTHCESLEVGTKELVHVQANEGPHVSGFHFCHVAARRHGRGIADIHQILTVVIDSNVHITSLVDGGNILQPLSIRMHSISSTKRARECEKDT